MKLTEIDIIHFGKLNNISFDLDGNLSIFQGANEAGKSTTLSFIKQIIFGFYLRNNKTAGYFEDYRPLSKVDVMGGSLTFVDDEDTYVLKRTYKTGNSKKGILTVTVNGKKVPDEIFFNKIQNINGPFYSDNFVFNQDTLRELNSLDQNELMERIYFLGAANSGKLLDLRNDFEKSAGTLFKKTGRNPIVNVLLKQVENQEQKVAQTNQEFEQYRKLEKDLTALEKQKNQAKGQLTKLREKTQKLNNLAQQLVNYQKYQDLKAKVKKVKFSENDFETAQRLAVEIDSLQTSLQSLEEQLTGLSKDDLKGQKDLQSLIDQKVEVIQWQSELRKNKQKVTDIENELSQLKEFQKAAFKMLKMSSQERENLKKDYQNLQASNHINPNQGKYLEYFGIGLSVIGLILTFIASPTCLILIAFGLGAIWYGYTISKKYLHQRKDFEEKYHIDPDDFVFDNSLNQMLQLQLKQQEINNLKKERLTLSQRLHGFIDKLDQAGYEVNENSQIVPVLNKIKNTLDEFSKNQQHLQDVNLQAVQLQTKIQDCQKELNQLYLKNNVDSMESFKNLASRANEQKQLQVRLDTLKNSMEDNLEKLQEIASDKDEFLQKQNQIVTELNEKQEKFNNLQQDFAQVKAEMKQLADSTAVRDEKQSLADLKSQVREESIQYLADLAVASWISKSLDLASNGRFPKMMKSAREYFKLLTGNHYVDLKIGKKIQVISQKGKKIEAKYLSRGTSEQLYFALKLAFVEQISDKIALPILIDDAFVNFDEQRTKYIAQLLEKLSKKSQILIFTQKVELAHLLGLTALKFNTEK